jgi:hypothetical protein
MMSMIEILLTLNGTVLIGIGIFIGRFTTKLSVVSRDVSEIRKFLGLDGSQGREFS